MTTIDKKLIPLTPLHIEYYKFDHFDTKDPGKWEIRTNGSIVTDACLMGWDNTEAEAIAGVKEYIHIRRDAGYDVRLTEWCYELKRYLDVYPVNPEHIIFKAAAKAYEDNRPLFRSQGLEVVPLLNLPPVCDSCSYDLRVIQVRHFEYIENDRTVRHMTLCTNCLNGATKASYELRNSGHEVF